MQRIKHTMVQKVVHRVSVIRGSKHLETKISRCLEPLMKSWHLFLKYYFYYQTFSSSFQQRSCSFITESQCYSQTNMSWMLIALHRQNRTFLSISPLLNTLPDLNNRCLTIYLTVLVLKKWLVFSGIMITLRMVQLLSLLKSILTMQFTITVK